MTKVVTCPLCGKTFKCDGDKDEGCVNRTVCSCWECYINRRQKENRPNREIFKSVMVMASKFCTIHRDEIQQIMELRFG